MTILKMPKVKDPLSVRSIMKRRRRNILADFSELVVANKAVTVLSGMKRRRPQLSAVVHSVQVVGGSRFRRGTGSRSDILALVDNLIRF